MDIVTHTLLGGTLAHAAAPPGALLGLRERVSLGGAAAAFPDIDFVAFPFNPLLFLSDWHQGPTHSVLLLPLWSLLIAVVFVFGMRRRGLFATAFWVSGLGLASHIVADVITAYGTAILYPLSDLRVGLATTFLIDPLFTAIVALGLGLSLWMRRRSVAALALGALCLYVSGQALLQQRAVDVGWASAQAQKLGIERLSAWPQPFSPFNWKLIGVQGRRHYVAYLNLANHPPLVPAVPGLRRLAAMAAAYQPPVRLSWRCRHRYGKRTEGQGVVERLWQHPRFAPFRRFAVHPSLSRIETRGEETCVWFTDLRYDLPALPDTFRFGFCRDGVSRPWQLFRLRYFSGRNRERLPQ